MTEVPEGENWLLAETSAGQLRWMSLGSAEVFKSMKTP